MAVVAEIIWYKADFMRANHNNEDFSALINYWRLFLCVGLKEREIKFWDYVCKESFPSHFP